MIPAYLKVSVKRVLLLLVAYSLCRVLFLYWNWNLYAADPATDLASAFLRGLRFDLSAILMTNSVLLALWMLPSRMLPVRWLNRKWLRAVDITLFTIINFICLGANIGDTEFVKFVGKRSSFELFLIRQDIQEQAVSILSSYWYLVLGSVAIALLLAWLTPRFPDAAQAESGPDAGIRGGPRAWITAGAWRLAEIALIVLAIRGGFQFKPLHPMDAYFSTHHELALLVLNTPFTLIRSQPRGEIEHARYFPTDRDAIIHLKKMTDLSRPPLGDAKGWNVVVIIIESFGSEYTGVANNYKGYTPFFDSLARSPGAFFYKLNFANARRSIEGLPAVICGLPSIMEAPILTSDFSNNRFECLPRILARHGYSTYFLHGAHNGSMHFDTFGTIAGFENFVGLNEYPKDNPEDFDHYWGVLDEPMLQYAAKTIDKAPKPVMLGLFTLSSHHPYYIPPKYRGKFPKGPLEIHESIGYTDYSLGKFFETARTKPWFNHTIFVLTADHTQKVEHQEYNSLLGAYRVPLLIYVPGLKDHPPAYDPARITQQIDVVPSVLDLLGIDPADRLLVGQSVFDTAKEGHAYNYTSYSYWYLDPHVMVDWGRPPHPAKAYHHDAFAFGLKEIATDAPEVTAGIWNLKAVVHYLSEGLLNNNLYSWRRDLAGQGHQTSNKP
jgi:phosphoglycerol transferase MdoB-like AlkP superfamily enzyme